MNRSLNVLAEICTHLNNQIELSSKLHDVARIEFQAMEERLKKGEISKEIYSTNVESFIKRCEEVYNRIAETGLDDMLETVAAAVDPDEPEADWFSFG